MSPPILKADLKTWCFKFIWDLWKQIHRITSKRYPILAFSLRKLLQVLSTLQVKMDLEISHYFTSLFAIIRAYAISFWFVDSTLKYLLTWHFLDTQRSNKNSNWYSHYWNHCAWYFIAKIPIEILSEYVVHKINSVKVLWEIH